MFHIACECIDEYGDTVKGYLGIGAISNMYNIIEPDAVDSCRCTCTRLTKAVRRFMRLKGATKIWLEKV